GGGERRWGGTARGPPPLAAKCAVSSFVALERILGSGGARRTSGRRSGSHAGTSEGLAFLPFDFPGAVAGSRSANQVTNPSAGRSPAAERWSAKPAATVAHT